ncbi:MAG TPA: ATP synthase F1 subunit delta [Candidatus Acidoferrales bacterium]|nr:ATP synthase F1 subunit delta [Candidatus Acidoferrales bacterium]
MKETRAAKRYAGALLGLASEMKITEKVAADMQLIRDWVESSNDLRLFFQSPIIDRQKKRKSVEALFKGRVDDLTARFLFLLIDKGREVLTYFIAVEYGVLHDILVGIENADLKAPYEFNRAEEAKVQSKLEQMTGKKVRISFSIEKDLIGGFMAQIGDTVYDGSVRRQLEILRQQLAGG